MEPAWERVVMLLCLLVPLAGVVPALLLLGPEYGARWSRLGALGAAAGWLALLVADATPEAGRLAPDRLGLAAAAGAALLAAALPAARLTSGAALTALTLGVVFTDGSGAPSAVALAAGLGVAVILAGLGPPWRPRTMLAPAGSAAILVAGLVAMAETTGWSGGAEHTNTPTVGVGIALAGGAAAVAALAALRPRQPIAMVLPGALLAATRGLPWLGTHAAGRVTAAGLAAIALLLAGPSIYARFSSIGRALVPQNHTGAALAVWVVVATIEPVAGTIGSAGLLAAGAVVAAVMGGRGAAVWCGLPGGVALVGGLLVSWGATAALVAGLAVATAAALAVTVASDREPQPGSDDRWPGASEALALAGAAWLIVVPSAWVFIGAPPLDTYEDGLAVAAAAGLVTWFVLVARDHRVARLPNHGRLLAPRSPPSPSEGNAPGAGRGLEGW